MSEATRTEKRCPHCKTRKPLAGFYRSNHPAHRDGRQGWCKECMLAYALEWRRATKATVA